MNDSTPWLTVRPLARRLVLGGAILGALVVAFGPYSSSVAAGETSSATQRTVVVAQADAAKTGKQAADAAKDAAAQAKSAARDAAKVADDAARDAAKDAEAESDEPPSVTIDSHGIRVEEGSGGKKRRVRVGLGGTDREYDSFQQFVHEDRGLALMVFGIVFVVFLTPVLITGLLIWYKLRKNRMLNDTMVKLAEKGVVPPAEALQALHTGQTVAAANAIAARAPLFEQAKVLRTQAAWSDLRKGVILVALGLSFIAYSMLADREPNWIGLVLLFLGIGYGFLWFFEDRQLAAPASGVTPPPPPAGGA
jgi:hypothetical protein